MYYYSKGAWGLSVWPLLLRIFTKNSISLNIYWRQQGSRYAIHARRNLPDKEFRYLRTVIVTAAVYQGLHSVREHLLLTYWHRAGLRPYTSSHEFAESCVFSKQSPPFISTSWLPFPKLTFAYANTALTDQQEPPPYPKVTGSICLVPSVYFFHSTTVFSTYPPVSVYSTAY